MQWRVLPFIFLLYVVAYLDRFNIGFAALTMNKELAISSQQFGLLVGMFFFGYILFEVPSNLLLHRIGARVWIARILITWASWPCSQASCVTCTNCTLHAFSWALPKPATTRELSYISPTGFAIASGRTQLLSSWLGYPSPAFSAAQFLA